MDLDQVGGSDFGPVFKVVNIVVSAVSVLGGLAGHERGFDSFLLFVWVLLLGGLVGVLEFKVPARLYDFASFYFSFLGRGVLYLFLGTVLVNGNIFGIIGGVIVLLVGAVYVALEFIPSIEPPANMQNGGSMISDDVEDII